jgi:hypothetical protein
MMSPSTALRRASLIGIGVCGLAWAASAQMPPPPGPPPPAPPPFGAPLPPGAPPGEAADIRACLCEQQAITALRASMDEKKQSLDGIQHELADLDAQLVRERPRVDVANPDSVARYKALLERHDAAYQRSVGPVIADVTRAVETYNQRVTDYNGRCAHQLFDAALMHHVEATLSCPMPR